MVCINVDRISHADDFTKVYFCLQDKIQLINEYVCILTTVANSADTLFILFFLDIRQSLF